VFNDDEEPLRQTQGHQYQGNPIMLMPRGVWRSYIEAKASLFDQVESLPEDEKLVLALHYYEGLSFAEIGVLMEMKEWDAIVLHTRAFNKLQEKLKEFLD
jgi:RNA polymerase sigma factor for flagellar operon FliA